MVEEIIADDPSLFIVGVGLKGNQGNQRLSIWLDGDNGVTIEQCSRVSRMLSSQLEEEELIRSKYTLEVSSAGLDIPLQLVRQYDKNVGRNLKVTLKDGAKVQGQLKARDGETILLEEKVKGQSLKHQLKLEEIDKSMVLVSFK